MLVALQSTWTLFFGLGLIMLGNGLQGTLLGVRASLEGFSTTVTGLVMTGYYLGFLFGSMVVPRLVQDVGHIRVFAALASLASVSVLVHAVFIDSWVWTLMRLLTGFSYAGLYVVTESWLNDRATNSTRGQLLSIYMIVMLGGMACGQLLLNLSEPSGFQLFVLISVLVSLSLVPISLTVVPAPMLKQPGKVSLRILYRASPLGISGIWVVGMAHGALFSMGAVFATQLGLAIDQVAYFMVSAIVGGIVLQWPIGVLSDRFDRRLIMSVITFIAGLCALLAGFAAISLPVIALFAITALYGGVALPLYSLCIAHTNDHLKPEQIIAASGTLVLINGIGACLGPVTASLLMTWLGPKGLFWWLGAAHLGLGVFAVYRMTRRAPTPLAEQGTYVAVPIRTSPVAAGIAAEEAVTLAEESAASSNSVVEQ